MDIEPELEDIEEMGENERFTGMPAGHVSDVLRRDCDSTR